MKLTNNKVVKFFGVFGIALCGISQANAVIVTNSGVDLLSNRHYVIDANRSFVAYTSGSISFGAVGSESELPAIESFVIEGSFDVEISHYWWNYVDGGSEGSQDTKTYSTDWVEFKNVSLAANGLPPSFQIPSFPNLLTTPTDFFGGGPCTLPLGPDTYCSGYSNGVGESLTGYFQGNSLFIDGSVSDSGIGLGGIRGQDYHIVATVVPVPAAFVLFATGLMGLGWRRFFAIA